MSMPEDQLMFRVLVMYNFAHTKEMQKARNLKLCPRHVVGLLVGFSLKKTCTRTSQLVEIVYEEYGNTVIEF